MKKSGYILLLIILFLQAGGMLIVFKAEQYIVQYKMIEKLENSQTTFEKLILPINEFNESQVSRNEISLKGKMYDVKSSIVKGDNVELLVICDVEEDNILENIKRFFQNSGKPGHEFPKQLQKLISLVYLPPSFTSSLFINSGDINNLNYLFPENYTCYSSIFIPPPELG